MRAIPRPTRTAVLILATLGVAVVLSGGVLWLRGQSGSAQSDCFTTASVKPTWTPGGGAGQQPVQGVPGPPKTSPTPIPVPTLSGGHVLVTMANSRATLSVPTGTVIDLDLTSGPWSAPVSSDSKVLPRLSTASSCDGSVRASFRVQGSGWIEAQTDRGGGGLGLADMIFRVNIVASSYARR
jgi:hypothetical protein